MEFVNYDGDLFTVAGENEESGPNRQIGQRATEATVQSRGVRSSESYVRVGNDVRCLATSSPTQRPRCESMPSRDRRFVRMAACGRRDSGHSKSAPMGDGKLGIERASSNWAVCVSSTRIRTGRSRTMEASERFNMTVVGLRVGVRPKGNA